MPIAKPQDFREAASKRRKTQDVEVEGVGAVRLRALSAGEAIQFQADIKKAHADGKNAEELSFALIARSWITEDGSPWLPEEEGVELARSLDPSIYAELVKAALKLNGIDTGAVEEAEKN